MLRCDLLVELSPVEGGVVPTLLGAVELVEVYRSSPELVVSCVPWQFEIPLRQDDAKSLHLE